MKNMIAIYPKETFIDMKYMSVLAIKGMQIINILIEPHLARACTPPSFKRF